MRFALAALVACGATTPQPAEPLERPEPPPAESRKHDQRATGEQCDRLLVHLVELEVTSNPTAKPLDGSAKQALIDARRDAFHSVCDHMSAAQIDCALRTADLDGLTKCGSTP